MGSNGSSLESVGHVSGTGAKLIVRRSFCALVLGTLSNYDEWRELSLYSPLPTKLLD
jgi:hypothetical protein